MPIDPAADLTINWIKARALECFGVDAVAKYVTEPDMRLHARIETPKNWPAQIQFGALLNETFDHCAKFTRTDEEGYKVELPMRPLDAAVRIIAATRAPGPKPLDA